MIVSYLTSVSSREEPESTEHNKSRIAFCSRTTPRLTKHGTENQKAYDLFNLGLYGWYTNTYNTDGLYKSASYLEQAIALDSNYAAAYALLAVINSRIGLAFGAARKEYDKTARGNQMS